jgi:HJR/Mrr/RecB family endonuclease
MKIIRKVVIGVMLIVSISSIVRGENIKTKLVVSTATQIQNQKLSNELIVRLQEIKTINTSLISFSEKRKLRKEVNGIKHQLRAIGNGGIYLSGGGIILIVILLIVLL